MDCSIAFRTSRYCLSVAVALLTAALGFAQNPSGMSMGGPPAQAKPAAEPAPPPPAPRVAVGEITGTPGASLMIPLYYTPDPKMPVKSINVEIDYVSSNLKFLKLSPGVAAEESGAEVKGAVTDGKPDDKGIVRSKLAVTAALPADKAANGLPDGLLAYLLFQVSLEAKPFAIRMNTAVPTAMDAQSKPVKVNAQNGMVVIELLDAMPEATCFFFTH